MPELPEVETVARTLRGHLVGRRITAVRILEPRLRLPVPADFAGRLADRRIGAVRRRAKYVLIDLDDAQVWVIHLGMTGRVIVCPPTRARERHDHAVWTLDDGNEVRFHDPRRFGFTAVLAANALADWPPFLKLGPDPLLDGFSGAALYEVAHRSRRRLKDLLLDQSVVAGLGNIYVNEVLFRAGLRPLRRSHLLTRAAADRLAREIPRLLREAIRWCGTSFSDYRDADGNRGSFQDRLCVYQRQGLPCRTCGTAIRQARLGNRGTFFCPRCQK